MCANMFVCKLFKIQRKKRFLSKPTKYLESSTIQTSGQKQMLSSSRVQIQNICIFGFLTLHGHPWYKPSENLMSSLKNTHVCEHVCVQTFQNPTKKTISLETNQVLIIQYNTNKWPKTNALVEQSSNLEYLHIRVFDHSWSPLVQAF